MDRVDALEQQSAFIFRESFRHFGRIIGTTEISNV